MAAAVACCALGGQPISKGVDVPTIGSHRYTLLRLLRYLCAWGNVLVNEV